LEVPGGLSVPPPPPLYENKKKKVFLVDSTFRTTKNIEPLAYGISNPLPMVYRTPFIWNNEPALLVEMREFNKP